MDKESFKTPPNVVNSNLAKKGQSKKSDINKIAMTTPLTSQSQSQSLPSSPSKSPSPTPNSTQTRKRIINKIPLDFSKLKQAGLDRKLAEVLSKQNLSTAPKIASESTKSSSSSTMVTHSASASASAAAAASSLETAPKTQVQRQSERQTAAPPIRQKTAPNLVTVDAQSLQIKALIKNKILNKMAMSPTTATATVTSVTAPTSPVVSTTSSPSSSFTVPIAKADITPRPKLLLNLVNQLPKHRAMCGVSSPPSRTRQQESPPQPKVRQQPTSSSQQKSRGLQTSKSETASKPSAPSKPLIVLENKVLAPNEKIDLRALRLPKMQSTEVPSISEAPKATSVPEVQKLTAKAKPAARILNLAPTTPGAGGKKFILNANKLKVPREQLAQMAKNIREQVNQQEKPPAKKSVEEVQENTGNTAETLPTIEAQESLISTINNSTTIQSSLATPDVAETLPKSKPESSSDAAFTAPASSSKSSASVTASSEKDVISAVDFIAQLKMQNSLDMSSYMNLSAEEMSLNELFSGCQTSFPLPLESKAEEELPIGKILKMEEMDILHATMNVDANESNVLCISPNAMRLQKSMQIEETSPLEKEKNSQPAETSAAKSTKEAGESNLNLSAPPTLLVTAPQEEQQVKAVQEEKQVKEATTPSTSRPAFRPKKGKINLVQRNKRNNVGKLKKSEEEADKKAKKQIAEFFNEVEAEELEAQENIVSENHEAVKDAVKINENHKAIESEIIDNISYIENNISNEAQVLDKLNEGPNKESVVKEQILIDLESNVDKIDKAVRKEEKVQEELDTQTKESVTKVENTETAIKKGKTHLNKTPDSEQNVDYIADEDNIPEQQILNIEYSKPPDNKEINNQIVEETCKTNLKTDIESVLNIDNKISEKESTLKLPDVQENINIEQKIIEEEEIPKSTTKDIEISLDNSVDLESRSSLGYEEKVANQNVILSNKKTGVELKATEESKDDTQPEEVALIVTKKRDLTQLYHPPKMPKIKHKNKPEGINGKNDKPVEAQSTISLMEILSQEEPAAQGEAQLPFRQDSINSVSSETQPAEVMGIQNLINKLAAENVVPTKSKENKETKAEEAVKVPRKKLVKTRPVLSAKRVSKAVPAKAEAVHPRKRALLAESKTNEAHRVPTSSTSDDDGSMFCGFDNEDSRSKSVTNVKHTETDISDDATPDYDETEEEARSEKKELEKKAKTEEKLETIIEQSDKEKEEESLSETSKEPTEVAENTEIQNEIPAVSPEQVVVKKKRGRPSKSAPSNPELNTVNKTEEIIDELPLKRKRKLPYKLSYNELSPAESTDDLPNVHPDSSSVAEDTPVAKRPRKSRSRNTTATELDTSMEPEEKPIKRRGRKKKIQATDVGETPDADSKIPSTPDAVVTSTPGAELATPKKRGRKPKFHNLLSLSKKAKTDGSTENGEEDSAGETALLKGPDYWPMSPDFNLRLLLIRNREQLETEEELRQDGVGSGSVQCGLCLVRCEENNWTAHLNEHYGIGWTIEKPPEMLTRGLLIIMMNNYAKGGKRLSCRLCERSLGSGLGMMLHLEGCGSQQDRVECEACKNMYSKLFIAQHYRSCSKRYQPLTTNTDNPTDENVDTTVFSNAGRAKRKSTIKAETKLQKIVEQMKKPIEEPNNKDFDADSSDYDMTADKESSEEYESDGVDSNEEEDQTKDDTKSSTSSKKRRKKSRASTESVTRPKSPITGKIIKTGDETAEHWKYFVQTNYAQHMLFPHILPRFEQLLPSDAVKLLPSRESTSMRYAYDKEEDSGWIQLAPLESFNRQNEHICHLGRPVKELAWVPLPPSVDTQYLLCSQRSKMLGFTRQCKDKQDDDLLLLLECTAAGKHNSWSLQTRLHYGITVPTGTVNTFTFMPSGGYDKAANRLALLAVGSALGVVIYALPLELSKSKKDNAVIVLQAVITLNQELDDPVRDPCTKVCWSMASGHNLLVTGYASGNVAFWDIADEDGINCLVQNDQRHFLPSGFFYFGERNIQTLELHYDTNGARWLAVGAAVRKFWIYDIANWSQPISILGDMIHNLYLGCLSWSPLWESLIIGCSELTRAQFPRMVCLSPVDVSSPPLTLDVMISSIRFMHLNCDQNMLASIADNGDICLLKANEFDTQTVLRRRKDYGPMGTTEACYLGDITEPQYVTPDVFQRDYGLLIRPFRFEQRNTRSASYGNPKRQPSFNLRSMMRLNCVRWNWNTPASSWIAVGAEHGLLRIMNYNYKSDK